ncbi:MAG TPA: hypothetical protein VF719_01015 [Abditibacteriaceae bacterium]|jgi:hypothetical protein
MSFKTYARRARRNDLPFNRRRTAFRACIELYGWLTNQKFTATYTRFSNHFGFDEAVPDADERLDRAINALETERNLFLEKLRAFDRCRTKEKFRGRRSPTKQITEALCRGNWLMV